LHGEQRLEELGLDSLMAVELRSLIAKNFGVEISTIELIQTPSIAKLAQRLLVGICGDESAERGAGRAPADVVTSASAALIPPFPGQSVPGGFPAWVGASPVGESQQEA